MALDHRAAIVSAVDSAGDWFVLHTRSRQEKALCADLLAMGVAHFLPLVETVRYYGRRKVRVELPLFPGYVFLRGTVEQAYDVDRTRKLANIIKVADQGALDAELRNIQLALRNGGELDPHPYLQQGAEVEVTAGPFRGLRGVVARRNQNRLVLNVAVLGLASVMEIDALLLEPVRLELVEG